MINGKKYFKILTIELVHNQNSNRIPSKYALSLSAIINREQKCQSIMVCGGICSTGETLLAFVYEGTKINHQTYC